MGNYFSDNLHLIQSNEFVVSPTQHSSHIIL